MDKGNKLREDEKNKALEIIDEDGMLPICGGTIDMSKYKKINIDNKRFNEEKEIKIDIDL